MKTIFLTALILVFVQNAFSQNFKPFKVDLGLSLNLPVNEEASSGGGFYIEPRYGVDDNFTIGIHMQWDYLSSNSVTVDNTSINVNSVSIQSYQLVSDYYFNIEKVRPFVGVGVGMYRKKVSGVEINSAIIQVGDIDGTTTAFGVSPRLGINIGHGRIYTSYNITGNEITNYFNLTVGFEIGGGRY